MGVGLVFVSLVSKSEGGGHASAPARSSVPTPVQPVAPPAVSPEKPGRGRVSWLVYVLALLGILVGAAGAYLAWETRKQSEEQIQAASQKIQSTEKDVADLRTTHEEARVALEKKIKDDTGKLRIELESASVQVQKLEEQGEVFSRELQVISTLKTQQLQMENRLASVDKTAQETSKRLELTQAGLEDLKKKALKASVTAQDPGARNPPVGMKIYLTREPLAVIAKNSGIPGEPAELSERWKSLFTSPSGNAQGQKIDNAVARAAVATGTVGQDGAVELQKVPPGDYYLLGATGQANGFVYEKKIRVEKNTGDVLLDRQDAATN